ncbi:MAG: hypothetical protein R2722_13375 [Tessaracoccus sp.]
MTMDLAGRLAQLTPEQREMLRRELARREAPAEKVYPLSLMQERLWFLCNFMPEATTPTRCRLRCASGAR